MGTSQQQDGDIPMGCPEMETTENTVNGFGSSNDSKMANVHIFVGMDIGSKSSVVASSDKTAPHCINIQVNSVANRSTPSIVAFDGKLRLIGEEAEGRMMANMCNTLVNFPCYIGSNTIEDVEKIRTRMPYVPTVPFSNSSNSLLLNVTFADQEKMVPLEIALAHYIRHLAQFAKKEKHFDASDMKMTIAIPDSLSDFGKTQLYEACLIAGITNPCFVNRSQALFNCWCCRHLPNIFFDLQQQANLILPESAPNSTVYLAIGDFGFAETIVQIIKLTQREDGIIEPAIIITQSDANLGVVDILTCVTSYVAKHIKEKYNDHVDPSSRRGVRLFAACSRAVKDLSGLNDSSIDIESFLSNEDDLHVSLTRATFEELCAPFKDRLESLMREITEKSDISTALLGIDVVGGGSRIPWVSQVLEQATVASLTTTAKGIGLRHTLDGASSIAMGAAYYSAGLCYGSAVDTAMLSSSVNQQEFNEKKQLDVWMTSVEDAEIERRNLCNEFESYILEMQNAMRGQHRELFQNRDGSLEAFLREKENWLLDNPDASYEECQKEYAQVKKMLHDTCPEYFTACEAANKKLEDELTKNAMEKSAEMKEDMDVKLPNSQCIKRAKKNKDEGNELFREGNCELAVQRYIKAVQYLAKMYDVSPQDKEEANTLKHSLHLNLGQAYFKLACNDPKSSHYETLLKKSISSWDAAIELEPTSLKALYKRSMALEMNGETEGALRDIKKALEIEPADPDCLKLKERIEARIKHDKARQKQMYSKMFG